MPTSRLLWSSVKRKLLVNSMQIYKKVSPNIDDIIQCAGLHLQVGKVLLSLRNSRESEFKLDKYTFDVGGKNKGKKQIEHVPDTFIVKDDIEYENGIIIPLWHFVFNY